MKSELLTLIQRIDAAQAKAHAAEAEAIRKSLDEAARIQMAGARESERLSRTAATEYMNMQNETWNVRRASFDEQHKQFLQYIRGTR